MQYIFCNTCPALVSTLRATTYRQVKLQLSLKARQGIELGSYLHSVQVCRRNFSKRGDREEMVIGASKVRGGNKRQPADVALAGQLSAACAAAGAREAAASQTALHADKRRCCGAFRCPLGEAHAHLHIGM
jgi:hypothetical protein